MNNENPNPLQEAWEALGIVLGVILLLFFIFGLFVEILAMFGIYI